MADPKFTPQQREAHMLTTAEMYLAGSKQVEIAAALGVHQGTVSRYLKKLQARWEKAATEAIDARKARELARIDRLEIEYWQAWQRSCQNAQTTVNRAKTVSVKPEDEPGVMEVPALEREWTHTERGQAGDPRFLQGVMSCIEMRLKIVGGFAATKVEILDWREEARKDGVDPNELEERLIAEFTAAMVGRGDPRSPDQSPPAVDP